MYGQACCSTQGFFMSKVLPISHILCRQLCSCVVNDVGVGTHHSLNCRHVMHCSESRQLCACVRVCICGCIDVCVVGLMGVVALWWFVVVFVSFSVSVCVCVWVCVCVCMGVCK